LTAFPVWAIFVAHFCNNWALYLLISWLPSYFREALGLSISNASLFAAAPWLATFVTANLTAMAADKAIASGVPVILVRRVSIGTALVGIAIFLMLARDIHSPATALSLVCAATGCLGLGMAGFLPNWLDIAPRHSAVLVGISNTIATIPGIAGVAITGWLVDTTGTYSSAFVLTAAVSVGGALFYLLFGSGRPLDGLEIAAPDHGREPAEITVQRN
jgi:ACS family sodium-dependent inorganic phosphate cotransporter